MIFCKGIDNVFVLVFYIMYIFFINICKYIIFNYINNIYKVCNILLLMIVIV